MRLPMRVSATVALRQEQPADGCHYALARQNRAPREPFVAATDIFIDDMKIYVCVYMKAYTVSAASTA
jgi:hypothetical protein